MLDRPSLLLNPWAVRSTQTGQQDARAGSDFAAAPPAPTSPAEGESLAREDRLEQLSLTKSDVTSNLDFLGESAAVISNLVPDEKGLVIVARSELGAHQHVHVVAIDPVSTAYRSVSLVEKPMKFRDLRLAAGLNPERHFTQQKRITVVSSGETIELADAITAKFEAYDSLARVYALYSSLNGSTPLAEFAFILNWPKLSPAEKQSNYSKYACHELNFFLFKKDPAFFQAVVKPYLANKKDRTFLDRWLLGESVESYLQPWNYEQLNVAERILLAQRVAADRSHGTRHVQDLFDMLPTDLERFNFLFRAAIRGSALEASDTTAPEQAGAAGRAIDQLQLGVSPRFGSTDGRLSVNGVDSAMLAERLAEEAAPLSWSDAEKKKEWDRPQSEAKLGRRRAGFGGEVDKDVMHFYALDGEARKSVRQLYEKLDKTQEWAENNYYQLPIEQQIAGLVTVSPFWRDYAGHDAGRPFFSKNFAYASCNFTEMMFALALLDLPFEAVEYQAKIEAPAMKLTAAGPMIVLHEEIRETVERVERAPILVSQNFFNAHDRYRYENNEQLDKFVTDEFLVHTVYGCQVVVTNPTSSPQKLDVLTQIPVGAMAVSGGEPTRSLHIQLQPFGTQTIEYFFYFPAAGKYPHYPVHVAKDEKLLASAEPVSFVAVDQLSRFDRASWEYLSQQGSADQVLEFLRQANLQRVNLGRIAFRMREREFFLTVIELLSARHAYDHTLWSYGIKHNVPSAVQEYLRHNNEFVAQCGEFVDCALLRIDPVTRKNYQHLDYLPLVNARAHQLGRRRQILNDRLFGQYHALLKILGYRPRLDDEDRMAVTYYLLLQDRTAEAEQFLAGVNSERLSTRLQYDYFAAYLGLSRGDISSAEQIALRHSQHPVDRWRKAFAAMHTQIDEIRGGPSEVLDPENRGQIQTQLASTEPNLDFRLEGTRAIVNYQNLDRVIVNYYLMDVELLFSRNPFVQAHGGNFSHIRPNQTETIDLPRGQTSHAFPLPEDLRRNNVLVEITGGPQARSQPYYANSLAVRMTENYGQLSVVTSNPGQPLSKVYVKVYARMKDGSVKFYKDGYTDLRGRFDYASLNTNELDFVDRFSLLVASEDHGALVREASPPAR
jgi:hypothetical protein